MLTDNDKRDIEKQTGVALDKDQKGKIHFAQFHQETSLQIASTSWDTQPVLYEFDYDFYSKLIF